MKEEVSLSITKETEVFREEVQEVQEGDVLFSVTSYDAEIEDAIDLVEGERVYVLETHSTEWWYVKKHLTEEKGWAPVQLLLDENSYMLYVQKKLHEKIDKLPVFEKPPPDEKSAAPRFVEKLQPKHTPDGTTVQFECQVEGNPRPLITWFRQTAIILPSQDFQMYYDEDNVATLIIKEVFPEDAGLFTCVAKNSSGFASSTTELSVEAPLSDHGSDATVLSRKSLSSFKSHICGHTRESSLADILEGIPPTFSRKPKARCVDEGTDVELECRLVAVPEPDITWYQSGEELTTGKNVTVITESDMHMYTSIVRISKVKRTQEGKYEVVARNREGEASVQITLKVSTISPLSSSAIYSPVPVAFRGALPGYAELVRTGEKEPPQILEPLKSVIVREGDSVRLSTLIVGNPSPKITWLKDGKPLKVPTKTEGDTHTVILLHPVPGDTAEYTVTAKNEVGTAKTTATVIVEELQSLEPPMFVERFQEEKVPEKGTVQLVAKVTGNPIPEITWLRNNEPLEPSETVTQTYDGENIVLEIKGVDSEVDAGDYKCVASNPVGKASHGARVTVDVDKPRIEVDDKSLLSLECETSHTVSTKWYHNDKELSGMDHRIVIQEGRTHRLVIKRTTPLDAGKYRCTVKNQSTESIVFVSESKPEFVRKLQDFEVKERECAILEVEISSEIADVTWHKEKPPSVHPTEIQTSISSSAVELNTTCALANSATEDGEQLKEDGEKVVFEKQGNVRKLLLRGTSVHDEGEYTCALEDQECTAEVTVVDYRKSHHDVMTGLRCVTYLSQEMKWGSFSPIFPELPPEIITKMQDLTVAKGEKATFEIELTKGDALVRWFKDKKELQFSEHVQLSIDGKRQKLKVYNSELEDTGEYSCQVGEQTSTAKLTVEGSKEETLWLCNEDGNGENTKENDGYEVGRKNTAKEQKKEVGRADNSKCARERRRMERGGFVGSPGRSPTRLFQIWPGLFDRGTSHVAEPVVDFITRLPDVTLIPLHADATFTIELSRPNVEVKWLKKGKELKPSNRHIITEDGTVRKLIIKKVTLDDQTDYSCVAINVKTSSKLKVEIIETAPRINIEALQKVYKVNKGDDVNISVKYSSTPSPTDEWSVNGKVIKKSKRIIPALTEESASLTIKKVEDNDVGTYTIRLKNNCGEASAELTLIIMEAPSQPGSPEVIEVTDITITLHWKTPESDGNSPITNYILEYHDREDVFTWIKVSERILETTHKVTSLDHNMEYMFRVTAVNDVGPSPPSHPTRYIKITSPVSMEPPTIQEPLKGVVCGLKKSITLSCVVGGVPQPEIKLRDGRTFKNKYMTYENRVAKYTITETTETTSGTYTCQATNDAGYAETTATVKIQEPPKIEVDEGVSTQKLRVTNQWKVEVKFTGYPKPTVKWTKGGKELPSTKHCSVYVDESSSTVAIYSLKKEDTGIYNITVQNEAGSASYEFNLRVIDKPSKPEGPIVVKDIRKDTVTIEWKPPADDGGLELSKYSVEKCELEKMVWMKVADVEKDVSSYCVQKLREDAEYMFRVIAENPVGSSEALESDTVTIRSKYDRPSPPRGPLDVSGMTDTSFTITWQPPETDGGSPILEYIVERREVNKKAWQKVGSTTVDVTHIEVSSLKVNISYHLRVTARNDVGPSVPYAPEEPITAGKRISAPSSPTNLTVVDVTSKSVTIQWGPPTSTGGTELTGYIVEKRQSSSNKWTKVVTLEPSVTQHCIANLKEKSEWFFRVSAENSIGLSPPASTELVSLKTHATVPSPPTAPLEIRSTGPNSIIIEWGIPESDGGAPLEGYTIAIRDIKKTMWMEVGRVKVGVQKLTIKDLQENHEYLIRIYARNEVGASEALESEEPFKVLRPTDMEQQEVEKMDTTAPTLSFSTETTTSWMREAGMDADIHSYARGALLRRDEYFFRIWYYARQLFK
uniref:Titin n=1 Tax=Timema californicum TaxID=61474 RepID=A0A7R9P5F6_TIMCA|nr:unnamed protein product [Timema californicum]